MEILGRLFGEYPAMLQEALGRTAARHRLLVGNLANVSTPGYKRRDVSFVLNMKEASSGSKLKTTHPSHISTLAKLREGLEGAERDSRAIRTDGNSVDLEREVAALVETQLHFSALAMAARRYFQGLREIIKEGR